MTILEIIGWLIVFLFVIGGLFCAAGIFCLWIIDSISNFDPNKKDH